MVDDPNKTEDGSFIEDGDFIAADGPAMDALPEKRNLKEIWSTTPSLKIFTIVAGLAFVIIVFMIFSGGDKTEQQDSNVKPTASVSQPPGTAELPPAYEDAVRKANEQTAQSAEQTGGSAIPTPIARPSERIEAPVQVEDTDPLSEWRKEAETRRIERQQEEDAAAAQSLTPPPALPAYNAQQLNGQQQAAPQQPPLPTGPSPEQVSALTSQFQQFLSANVIEPQTPKESNVISLNIQPGYNMEKYFPKPQQNVPGTTVNANGQVVNAASQQKPKAVVDAGTIAYAQILTEANSDIPGPVLAEVASGPLAGGRAIGQFSVAERRLVVTFNRIVKDGVEYNTQAYALDPATTLTGMATSVDDHYFRRVFLPAAAKFIQGYADAVTQTNNQVIVTDGTVVSNSTTDLNPKQELLQGVNEGAQELSDIIDDDADRPITVRIHAGTRIGLLFTQAVQDPNAAYGQQQNGQQQATLGQSLFNATPAGQVYNAYNAYNSAQQVNTGNYGNTSQQNAPAGSMAAFQQQQQAINNNLGMRR